MSAEPPSDICWTEHVNRFLHGPFRPPETGVTCACVCFYTQRARIRFGFGKGKINTSNEHAYRSKTAYSYYWCKLNVFVHVLENFNRHIPLMASLCTRRTRQLFRSRSRSKAIPLQAWTGPENSRRLRFPDFKTKGT